MTIDWLVAGLVVAFLALDAVVLAYLFRRSTRRASARPVPHQWVMADEPPRDATKAGDALVWTTTKASMAFRAGDSSLVWTDDLDGYSDFSRFTDHSDRTDLSRSAMGESGQSSPSASSKAE
jgi:hypothetical protein